jgi:hypothetical protein
MTQCISVEKYHNFRQCNPEGGDSIWELNVFMYVSKHSGSPGARGGAMVEALRYKPKGRGIDSRWCHWNFSLTQSFRSHYGPGVDSTSNINDYQKYFLGIKAAGA